MIRQPVKIGSITAEANATKNLTIPVGHKGTICGLYFMPCNGANPVTDKAVVLNSVEKLMLEVTHQTEGGFAILNDVTPELLYFRELYYGKTRGMVNEGAIITYDPSAAQRGGEAAANMRNLGTADLSDMNLRVTFNGTVTGLTRIDVYADIDYNLKANLGVHVRMAHVTAPVAATGGDVEIANLPCVDARFAYETIFIQENSLTNVTVDKTSFVINGSDWKFRDIPRKLFERLQVEAHRAPQTGFMSYDFAKEDNPSYFLQGGMAEIKLIPTFKAGTSPKGGNVKVWYEIIRIGK